MEYQQCDNSVQLYLLFKSNYGEDFFNVLRKGKIVNEIIIEYESLAIREVEEIYDNCLAAWLAEEDVDLDSIIWHVAYGYAENQYDLEAIQSISKWDLLSDYFNKDYHHLESYRLEEQKAISNIKK